MPAPAAPPFRARLLAAALAAAAAALLLGAAAAAAPPPDAPEPQGPPVTLTLRRLRKDGPPAKHGAWTWLAVALENKGDAPVEGALRAFRGASARPADRSAIVYERSVALAPRSRRVERLLYFCRDSRARVVAALFSPDDPVSPLAEDAAEVIASEDFVALVVSKDDAACGLFPGALVGGLRRRAVFAAPLGVEDLPERAEALGSVDAVLFAGIDARSLTPAQGEAIEGFVEAGGEAVLCFGGNPGEWKDSPLEALLPVDPPERVEPLATPALAAFAGAPPEAIPGEPLVAVARPLSRSEVLVREGEVPLAVRRRSGKGFVTYLAVDPTRRPLRGSPAGPGLVARLFGSSDPIEPAGPFGLERGDPFEARLGALARAGEAFRPPPFAVVGAILGAYVILVVPLNYRFWRRRGRAERAAPTAIVLGVVTGALIYGIGIAYKGRLGLMSEVVLLEGTAEDARGAATAFCGLYSAERRLARIESSLAAAPAPVPPGPAEAVAAAQAATIRTAATGSGGAARAPDLLESVELNQWALRAIAAEGPADIPVLRCDLGLRYGRLEGTIEAPAETALEGAFVIFGRRAAAIGDVAAGAARAVSARLSPLAGFEAHLHPLGEPFVLKGIDLAAAAARRPLLPAGDGALEAVVVAAIDPDRDPILRPDFAPPRRRAARLLIAAAPVRFRPGPVEIPPGVVRPRVVAEIDGRVTAEGPVGRHGLFQATASGGEGSEPVYRFDRGRLDLEFTLPLREGFTPEVAAVDLRLVEDAPRTSVFVHGAHLSRRLEMNGSRAEIPDPGEFFDPRTGTFRVSVEPPAGSSVVFLEPEIAVRGRLEPPPSIRPR